MHNARDTLTNSLRAKVVLMHDKEHDEHNENLNAFHETMINPLARTLRGAKACGEDSSSYACSAAVYAGAMAQE